MNPYIATFSIAACDPANGDLGVAVASKFLAVGSVVPFVQAGAGAVATQAMANMTYGPRGLELMAAGHSAADTLQQLLESDPDREQRQVGLVDARGGVAAHTGKKCFPWAGHITGDGYTIQGNILAGRDVVDAMQLAFRTTQGELAEKLMAALQAGDQAGGDSRGRQAAALYVARAGGSYGGVLDRYVDLRVDDHAKPVDELDRLLQLHRFYLTPPNPQDMLPIDENIAIELQTLLSHAGHYSGPITGMYDEETHRALHAYGGIENLEERLVSDTHIDPQVLHFMRNKLR